MRIFAADPSINFIGWAIASDGKLLKSGLIKSVGSTDADRLHSIHSQVIEILFNEKIDRAYVERMTWVKLRGGKNLNVSSIVKMAKACGVIELVLCDYEIPIFEPSRSLARKERAMVGAKAILGSYSLSEVKSKKLTTHEAEAIVWAVFYSRMDTNPIGEK